MADRLEVYHVTVYKFTSRTLILLCKVVYIVEKGQLNSCFITHYVDNY